jgi:hypothetical protein
MMKNTFISESAIDAVIHLKNGKTKHGLLLEETPGADNYFFVSYNSLQHFEETQSPSYIEVVPGMLIEAIETDLK